MVIRKLCAPCLERKVNNILQVLFKCRSQHLCYILDSACKYVTRRENFKSLPARVTPFIKLRWCVNILDWIRTCHLYDLRSSIICIFTHSIWKFFAVWYHWNLIDTEGPGLLGFWMYSKVIITLKTAEILIMHKLLCARCFCRSVTSLAGLKNYLSQFLISDSVESCAFVSFVTLWVPKW